MQIEAQYDRLVAIEQAEIVEAKKYEAMPIPGNLDYYSCVRWLMTGMSHALFAYEFVDLTSFLTWRDPLQARGQSVFRGAGQVGSVAAANRKI